MNDEAQASADDCETFLLTPEDTMSIEAIVPTMPTLNVPMPSLTSTSSKTVPKNKKKASGKNKRTSAFHYEWTIADKSRVEILTGRVALSENGAEFHCTDCDKTYKCKRNCDSSNLTAPLKTASHLSKKASGDNTRRHILAGIEK